MSTTVRRLFVVTGQTGTGKDEAVAHAALTLGARIFCLDAIKVYRRMDVGTDKPPREWRERVSYYGLDLVEPWESFNVGRYLRYVATELSRIPPQEPILVCGGTGLYLMALVRGLFDGPPASDPIRARLHERAEAEGNGVLHQQLGEVDPVAAARIHPNDRKRLVRALEVFELTGRPITDLQREQTQPLPGTEPVLLGLRRGPEGLRERIGHRSRRMVEAGLLEETSSISSEGGFSREAAEALGYRQALEVLTGDLPAERLAETIARETWRFARRQATWFRSFANIDWIDIVSEQSAGALGAELVRRVSAH